VKTPGVGRHGRRLAIKAATCADDLSAPAELLSCLVGLVLVVVLDVLGENGVGVGLVDDEDSVEDFAPYGPHDSFAGRVRSRGPGWGE